MEKIRIITFFVIKEHKWSCCSPGVRTSSKVYQRKERDFHRISWVARYPFPWRLTWNTCRTLEKNPNRLLCRGAAALEKNVRSGRRRVYSTPAQVVVNPAHAKASCKLGAAPSHQSQAGQVARKGHSALTITWKMQLLPFVWRFPQNPLTSGNGKVQTSKLDGIKLQLTPKVLEADPRAAGLLMLLYFLVGHRGCPDCDGEGRMSTLTTE